MNLSRSKRWALQLADTLGHGKMFVISYPDKLMTTNYAIQEPLKLIDYAKSHSLKEDHIGLYIHLPFCEQKCKFCNFTVSTIQEEDYHTQYVDKLLQDMTEFFASYQGSIHSIDIGGGTPLLLSTKNLTRISEFLAPIMNSIPNYETTSFSFEQTSKIATLYPEKMAALVSAFDGTLPVRTSMGIQTIHPSLLQAQKRSTTHIGSTDKLHPHHENTLHPVLNCREILPVSSHVSADIIFPLGTLQEFHDTVQKTIELGYDSITAYDIIDCYGGGIRSAFQGTPQYNKEAYGKYYDYWYSMMISNGFVLRYGSNNAIRRSKLDVYLQQQGVRYGDISHVEGDFTGKKKRHIDEEEYLDYAAKYAVSSYYHHRISLGEAFVGFGVGASSKLSFSSSTSSSSTANQQLRDSVWLFNPTQLPAWMASSPSGTMSRTRREVGFAYRFPHSLWMAKDIRYQIANFGCIHFTLLHKKFIHCFPNLSSLLSYYQASIDYVLSQQWMEWKVAKEPVTGQILQQRLVIRPGSYRYVAHIRALFTMGDGEEEEEEEDVLESLCRLYTEEEYVQQLYDQRKRFDDSEVQQSSR